MHLPRCPHAFGSILSRDTLYLFPQTRVVPSPSGVAGDTTYLSGPMLFVFRGPTHYAATKLLPGGGAVLVRLPTPGRARRDVLPPGTEVRVFGTERELAAGCVDLIRALDPDVIGAWDLQKASLGVGGGPPRAGELPFPNTPAWAGQKKMGQPGGTPQVHLEDGMEGRWRLGLSVAGSQKRCDRKGMRVETGAFVWKKLC